MSLSDLLIASILYFFIIGIGATIRALIFDMRKKEIIIGIILLIIIYLSFVIYAFIKGYIKI